MKKSGYHGVSWDERHKKWRAVFSRPWTHCGYFESEIQAAFAYDLEAKKQGLGPEMLNFPRGLNVQGKPL